MLPPDPSAGQDLLAQAARAAQMAGAAAAGAAGLQPQPQQAQLVPPQQLMQQQQRQQQPQQPQHLGGVAGGVYGAAGRSTAPSLNFLLRKIMAHSLATEISMILPWTQTSLMPADALSRELQV